MTFKPGKSGNPSGRPPGIIDKRVKFRDLLDQHANAIIEKLIERAIAGDTAALRLCMERLIPRVKPDNSINFQLPEGSIGIGDNMMQITQGITNAVVSGQMSIEEAEKFASFFKAATAVL